MGIKKLFLKSKNNLSLALDKRYLRKDTITYTRRVKFSGGGNDYLYFYLAHLIPESKLYNDFEYLKESGGLAYRFEDATVSLIDCTLISNSKNNRIYLDFGNNLLSLVDLQMVCNLDDINNDEYAYLNYILKQGFTLEVYVDGGPFRIYDKKTNAIEVKEHSGSTISVTIIPNI